MRPRLMFPLGLMTALALGACTTGSNPVRDAFAGVGIGPKSVQAPDFVATSRPASLDYTPVGVAPPPRARAKRADEVKDAEAEMEAVRARNEARGAQARRAGAPASGSAARPAGQQ